MSRRKKLELTPRLQALADWVEPGARIVDVGTDHGYLPIWLLINKGISAAIASDLRRGPLSRAQCDAAEYGVESRIDFRLCDGLKGILPDEADTIIIAGMGGETITGILHAAPWTADGRHTMLLQPMTKGEVLRGWLAENGYCIERERLIQDRGTIYPLLWVRTGQMELSMGQQYCGAALLHDPLEERYVIEKIIRLLNAIYGLKQSERQEDRQKLELTRSILTESLFMREEWRHANCSGN